MFAMTKTHQKAFQDLTTMQDRRLADLAQSQERNMVRIPELLHNQRNDRVAGHAPLRPGPDPSLAPIHDSHPAKEGVDSVMAVAVVVVPIVDGENATTPNPETTLGTSMSHYTSPSLVTSWFAYM
ncbi:hypothetical protein Scep_014844 [Stephania cephalantha]|uniref:Uncharacterized protein n=1 Tax=Stephania cephalantha TaxID=152367 RepID=A0AAP0J238_9MAGN